MDRAAADRFRRIDALFDAALDQPPEERAAFLEEACTGDHALHAQVLALLAAVDIAEDEIGEDIGAYAADLLVSLGEHASVGPALAEGTLIGPWRVLREVGRGGMGAVYLAERADGQFEMRVAIKQILHGGGAEQGRRFDAERRILATLDHPSIARLLDGGTTEAGVPYLVMQYVDGQSIDNWCDAHRLEVRGRVALVRDVARAVHHAHTALIVHRDVKPSNILVTEGGVPVLLDFGIARLLEDDDGDAGSPRTRTGAHLVTPAYAAPEQLAGAPVTTATDVHALGAVLYELLSGKRPFGAHGSSMGATLRAVMEIMPPAPSAAVAAPPPASADRVDQVRERAAARRTTPSKLRAALRGDLDTIVLRALAKEPERRYASALQFAEDLDRWLNGLPVLARPDRLGYRAGKFVRRHRAGVAAATVAVLLLAGAGVALAVSAERTTRALHRAELERDRAEHTATFLQGLFSASNPYAPRADRLDTLRVPALLAIGAAQAREEAALRPLAAADLMIAIAGAYRGLGAIDDAEPLLHEAAGLLRADGADPRQLAAALNEAGVVLLMRQRPAEAEPLFREAVELGEKVLPPGAPKVLTMRMNLASSLQDQGRFDDAAPVYDDVLAALRLQQPVDSVRLAETLNARGTLAHRTGDADQAVRLLEEALAINRTLLGDEHPRVAREIHNVAFVMDRAGRLEEAEPLYRLSADLHGRLLGDGNPFASMAATAYADALARLGRPGEARPLFERALPVQRAALGPRSPDLALTLRQYASLLEGLGENAAAEAAARENLEILLAAFGPDHPGVASARERIARLECPRGSLNDPDGC